MATEVEVPVCLEWTAEEVAEWIGRLGFPQYKECFTTNHVTGRRLVWVEASTLPRMGITNWKHIQCIADKVRELLHLEQPYWNRTITSPHRSKLGIFLERKSFSGTRADQLKYEPQD